MHISADTVCLCVMLTMVSVAAITDWRTGLIPNAVVSYGALLGVLAQLAFYALDHVSATQLGLRVGLGILLGAALPLVLYAYGALGGGDVKLFAAIGLCVGPEQVVLILLWSHVIALGLVPLQLGLTGKLLACARTSLQLVRNLFLPRALRTPIPRAQLTSLRFAPAIWAAAIWVSIQEGLLP